MIFFLGKMAYPFYKAMRFNNKKLNQIYSVEKFGCVRPISDMMIVIDTWNRVQSDRDLFLTCEFIAYNRRQLMHGLDNET